MQSDGVTKVLLAAILLCLVLLVGQQLTGISRASAPAAASKGRYDVQLANMRKGGPLLIRADLETGVVWRKGLMSDGPWVIVDEETRNAAPSN